MNHEGSKVQFCLMSRTLQERAVAEQLENIKIMQLTWQEVDVEEEGLVGHTSIN
jgi:hypothetical protein